MSPLHGALLGCSKRDPISRGRGQNPLQGQVGSWKGCPQAVLLMAMVAHTHSHQHSPKRPRETQGGRGAPMQGVNPCLARTSSAGPCQGPSSLQAHLAAIQHGFAGEWARGASALLEESECLSDKVPQGRQAPGALGFPLSPGVHAVPPCPGLSG